MPNTNIFKLENCDPDDVEDAILKVELSFGLKFDRDDFKHVKTFGDLCDVACKINATNADDCTSQQAFYKIREAMVATCSVERGNVKPDTSLASIFTKENRIGQIQKFEKALGIKLDILGIKNWIGWSIAICYVASLTLFFFNREYALVLIAVTSFIYGLASNSRKELKIVTVRQLTEKMAAEHYRKSRRRPGSYNKNEVIDTIKRIFINNLDIEATTLTRDAAL